MTSRLSESDITVYQSGNSKVVTIPSHLPVKVGDKFKLIQTRDSLILKRIKTYNTKIQISKLESLSGRFPGSTKGKGVNSLEKTLEGIYE